MSPTHFDALVAQQESCASPPLDTYDLVVIGGGSAGLAAALAAHENGAQSILVVERRPYLGGILPQCLHDGFGLRVLKRSVTGVAFGTMLVERFAEAGIPTLLDSTVTALEPIGSAMGSAIPANAFCLVQTPLGLRRVAARTIILATGCRERPFGALSISGTRPAGILTAGAAQEMVNIAGWDIGERIVILGSGDVGMIMAGRFAELGKDVVALIEKKGDCGGLVRNRKRFVEAHGIPLYTRSTISRVFGRRRLTGVEVCSESDSIGSSNKKHFQLACDTLLVSVGLIPEVDLLHTPLKTVGLSLEKGHLPSRHSLQDKLPWLFACGNAREVQTFVDDVYTDGQLAGIAAARFL